MPHCTLTLDSGGAHRLHVRNVGQGWRVHVDFPRALRSTPLQQAYLSQLRFGAEGIRLAPGQTELRVTSQDGTAAPLRVWLGDTPRIELGCLRADLDGPQLVRAHMLSPIEARYLADNMRPHPVDAFTDAGKPAAGSPRTDLHTHFAGCVRAQDLVSLALEHGIDYPGDLLSAIGIRRFASTSTGLAELSQDELDRLTQSLHAPLDYQLTFADLQTIYRLRRPLTKSPSMLQPLLWQVARDYAAMGVSYVELSLYDSVFAKVLRVLHEVCPQIKTQTGVDMRFLAAMNRHDDAEWDLDYLERIATVGASPLIAGVDFMGHETNSTHAFAPIIEATARWASRHRPGFVVRVHAGENAAYPENVRVAAESVTGFDVQLRIGHGLYGADARALDALREVGGIVEVNLNSNFALNNIKSGADAPVWRYLQAGIDVVLGTDGYGIYQSSIPLEWQAARLAGLPDAYLTQIHGAEQRYLARRHSMDEQHCAKPGTMVVPDDAAPHHYSEAVESRKAEARIQRAAAVARTLSESRVQQLVHDEFATWLQGRRLLSIAGAWKHAHAALTTADRDRITAVLRDLLTRLDPQTHVLLTGGTRFGVEAEAQAIAHEAGLSCLGALVADMDADALDTRHLTAAFTVADDFYAKAAALYELLHHHGALALFIGGGPVVHDEIQVARNLRVPYLCFAPVAGASGVAARQHPRIAFEDASTVIERLPQRWSSGEGRYWHSGANPTVDMVVLRDTPDGDLDVLLVRRARGAGTEAGKWGLPGGFQETGARPGEAWTPGKESALDAAMRELLEETSLDVHGFRNRIVAVGTFSGGGRDPRDSSTAWSVAHAFVLRLEPGELREAPLARQDAADAAWFGLKTLPAELAFDHAHILDCALTRIGC